MGITKKKLDTRSLFEGSFTGPEGRERSTRCDLIEKMQAYPSITNGHGQAYALPSAPPTFYNGQAASSAYSAILPSPYGRSLKQSGQAPAGYLASPYTATFPAQSSQSPYAAYPGGPYNASFSPSPGCSSPAGFTAQQALDFSGYGSYGQNPAAYAYYSAAQASYTPAGFMTAAAQAQAASAGGNPTNLSTHSTGPVNASYSLPQLNATPTDSRYSSNSTTTTTPSPPLKEITPNGTTGKKGRSKQRGRRQNNPSPPPESDNMERVFIWDLDETIIFLYSLAHPEDYSSFHTKISDLHIREISQQMEAHLNYVAGENFFHYDLEDCDQVHIDDVSSDDNNQDLASYSFATDGFRAISPNGNMCMASGVRGGVDWMRKLAFRYRRIKENYNTWKGNAAGLCCAGTKPGEVIALRSQLDDACSGWTSMAKDCLSIISRRTKCANVLVTNNLLVASITKVLLFGLGTFFPVENIYSSAKVGKDNCFERIAHRFGKSCTFVVIGNKSDTEMAAKEHKFPYWRVNRLGELANLHLALKEEHL